MHRGCWKSQVRRVSALAEVPGSVVELWADFDPCRDALETEVIREWKEEGGGVQAGALLHWQLQREAGTDGGDLWVSGGREGEGAGGDAHPWRGTAGVSERGEAAGGARVCGTVEWRLGGVCVAGVGVRCGRSGRPCH